MPKDTKTRYQGVYARHKTVCTIDIDGACSCIPSYYGTVWDAAVAKKHKTAFVSTPRAANTLRSDLKIQMASGRGPVTRSMRFKAAVSAFLEAIGDGRALNKHGRRYKASAIRDLKGALEGHAVPALGGRRLADLRRRDVQTLVDELAVKLSGSRVRTVVNALRSLYAWAEDREYVDHDPAARVRLPAMNATPRDRVATIPEVETLLAALPIEDALPYGIAAYAGARRNEIRHLLVEDADMDLLVIYLGADENARKSRAAQRAVPIVKPLATLIRRALLKAGRPAGNELLCPGRRRGQRNSGRLSFEALQTRADATWEPRDKKGNLLVAKKVGDRITAHECRHTFISWLDAAGVRQHVISEIAGHAILTGGAAVTRRYTHSLPDDLERARMLFEAFLASHRRKATA